jgi:hypothetical protein
MRQITAGMVLWLAVMPVWAAPEPTRTPVLPPELAHTPAGKALLQTRQELETWQKAHPGQKPTKDVVEGIMKRHPLPRGPQAWRPAPKKLTAAQLQRRQRLYQRHKAKADRQLQAYRQRGGRMPKVRHKH